MRISCGTDIIEIDRIKQSIEKIGEKFIKTIFTEREIEYCEKHKTAKYQHYAVRFAAKEAVFKAVSNIVKDQYSISWKDAEIINTEKGKPEVIFSQKNKTKIQSIDLSLSHCKKYAVATVVILYI